MSLDNAQLAFGLILGTIFYTFFWKTKQEQNKQAGTCISCEDLSVYKEK